MSTRLVLRTMSRTSSRYLHHSPGLRRASLGAAGGPIVALNAKPGDVVRSGSWTTTRASPRSRSSRKCKADDPVRARLPVDENPVIEIDGREDGLFGPAVLLMLPFRLVATFRQQVHVTSSPG